MRRGRNLGAAAALVAAITICFIVPGSASAASPTDICRAIAGGTFNAANYTQDELAAYQSALAGDATIQGYCSPLPIVPPPPTVCAEGQTQSTGPNGEVICSTTTTTPAPAPTTTSAVLPASHESAAPTSGVKGATKVKAAPAAAPARQAAPLATTRSSGALPFTGVELSVFAVVGLALIAGGLLLRTTARHRRSTS